MPIAQDRPLCFFDLETTGVDPTHDRIVEIFVLRREADGAESSLYSLVNPGCPIPKDAADIHGIDDDRVKDAPTFAQLAPRVLAILEGADLAGYNIASFDMPMLAAEFKRAGIDTQPTGRRIVDAFQVFKRREPHNLATAYRQYTGRELGDDAHSAEADVRATAAVLDAQAERYAEIGGTVERFAAWLATPPPGYVDVEGKFRWRGGEAVFAFGKNQGRALREVARVDRSFLDWMLRQSFPKDTAAIVRAALVGKFPEPPKT